MYTYILKTQMFEYWTGNIKKQNEFKLILNCPLTHPPSKNTPCIYQLPPHLFTQEHINIMFAEKRYAHLQHLDDTIIEKYNNIIYNELTKNLYHVVHLNIKRYRGSKPAKKICDKLFNFCLAKHFNNDVIGIIYSYINS